MEKIRVALVGTGGMGKVHYANYQHLPEYEVVAVCDSAPASVKLAEEWNLPHFNGISEMLGAVDADLVDICTPTFLHHDMVMESLSHGKNTITEKPIALSLKDAVEMLGELKKTASELLNVPQEDLIFRHRTAYSRTDPEKKVTYPEIMASMGRNGRLAVGAGYYNPKTTYLNPADMSGVPYELYSYATCIMEVEVDTDTGEVQLLKCVSAHDVGTPVGVKMCEGQIEGGTAMGSGFVISEEIKIDPKTCAIKNPTLSKYIIESNMDVPEVYPVVVCSDGEAGPFGAKGIGEPALIPSIPATMAAIGNALGVTFRHTPVLPADIVKAWKDKQAAEAAAQ